jgi:hypothetical protein
MKINQYLLFPESYLRAALPERSKGAICVY